jgi:hypothetical protein
MGLHAEDPPPHLSLQDDGGGGDDLKLTEATLVPAEDAPPPQPVSTLCLYLLPLVAEPTVPLAYEEVESEENLHTSIGSSMARPISGRGISHTRVGADSAPPRI